MSSEICLNFSQLSFFPLKFFWNSTLPVVLRHAGRRHRPGGGLDDGPEGGRVSVGLLVQPRAVLLDVQRDHVRRPRQVSAVAEVGRAHDRPHRGKTAKIKGLMGRYELGLS